MAQSSEIKSETTVDTSGKGCCGAGSPKTFTTAMDGSEEDNNATKCDENQTIIVVEEDEEEIKDQTKQPEPDDDLEDGEIESDDDEPIVTSVQPAIIVSDDKNKKQQKKDAVKHKMQQQTPSDIPIIDLSEKPAKSYASVKSSRKFTRPGDEDDWAKNIENAIAAALKKDGIEPSRPEFKRREEQTEEPPPKSKSRKRKKRDPEKEKNKKRKHIHEEPPVESDIDENEMLCIRGASPPPLAVGTIGLIPEHLAQPISGGYYDSDGSYTSYDSDDSVEYRKSYEEKRQNRRNKDRRQRKGSGRGGGGGDKRRNRDDSDGDDCARNHDGRAQRKLELCKFYLMECCAKKEKCLYMHSDFPCKYYYLGMECTYKGSCMFSHGKPLTDQLRNILLKHIETAPKEILGNFRRISRENAINLLNTTHAKLCEEFGVDNTLAITSTSSTVTTTIASSAAPSSSSTATTTTSHPSSHKPMNNNSTPEQNMSNIPSLLDMVIKPPPVSPRKDDKDKLGKCEKLRKSRWCDNQTLPNMSIPPPSITSQSQSSTTTAATTLSSFLSLKNLTGVITYEQIEKLESLGIENLEQVNQLTVAQLNSIGLTISQINEIQLNALNIQKLGLIGNNSTSPTSVMLSPGSTATANNTSMFPVVSPDSGNSVGKCSNQDVDMRLIVSTPPKHNNPFRTDPITPINLKLTDSGIASPEPLANCGKNFLSSMAGDSQQEQHPKDDFTTPATNNSVVDYSQYLKDAHIDADKIDLNNISLDKDDEALNEDEPELLIDESWCPSEDEQQHPRIESKRDDDSEENWDDDLDRPTKKVTTSKDQDESDWGRSVRKVSPSTSKNQVENDWDRPARKFHTNTSMDEDETGWERTARKVTKDQDQDEINWDIPPRKVATISITNTYQDPQDEDNWDSDDGGEQKSSAPQQNPEPMIQADDDEEEEDWSVCVKPPSRNITNDDGEENWDDDIDTPTITAQETQNDDSWGSEDKSQNHDKEESWNDDYEQQPQRNFFYNQGKKQQQQHQQHQQQKQQQYQQQPNQPQWGFNMSRPSQCYPPYMQFQYQQHYQQQQQQFQMHQQQQQQYMQQQQQQQQHHHHHHHHQQQQQQQEQPQQDDDEEENWDDDLDHNKLDNQQNQIQQPDKYPPPMPMPAIYDPKVLLPPLSTSKIDVSSSVSSMMGTSAQVSSQSYLDAACGLIQEKVENEARHTPAPSDPREFRDPRLYKSQQLTTSEDNSFYSIRSPPQARCGFDGPKYIRTSIYDGTPRMLEDDLIGNRKPDNIKILDPTKSDIDLRLPFKRVMTNYTPATEIDGSISSHPPIAYKVVEIEIPKPDYSEVRRNVPVTDKTLDPRLRRIFCLKESTDGDSEATSFLSGLNRQSEAEKSVMAAVLGGPRVDPRRKKENQDLFGVNCSGGAMSTGTSAAAAASSKTLDIRMLLQKSDWYKNLNSKVKIMVNQQLALVSTELKKFHQDPSPNKVFDIQFIVSNQYLQQILTNLGIYIDDYGEVRQLENDGENDIGGMIGMGGMGMGMMDPTGGLPPMGTGPPPMMPIEFLRGPPPMAMQQRFMGGMMPFGPPKPGLLGIAPGVGFNPFDSNTACPDGGGFPPGGPGYDDSSFPGDGGGMFGSPGSGGGGGGGSFPSGGNFFRSGSGNRKNDNGSDGGRQGSGSGRGNRNYRGSNNSSGGNSRNNDRWGGNNNGSRNEGGSGNNRRNYDNSRGGGGRGGGNDSRRDKSQKHN